MRLDRGRPEAVESADAEAVAGPGGVSGALFPRGRERAGGRSPGRACGRLHQRHPAARPPVPQLRGGHVPLVSLVRQRGRRSLALLRVPELVRALGPHPHLRDRQAPEGAERLLLSSSRALRSSPARRGWWRISARRSASTGGACSWCPAATCSCWGSSSASSSSSSRLPRDRLLRAEEAVLGQDALDRRLAELLEAVRDAERRLVDVDDSA